MSGSAEASANAGNWLTRVSLRRPVTITMFFVSVTVIGVLGGQRLPLEFLPDIEFPGLTVVVPYRNSTPEEVERRITRPVEEALATLSGIEEMRSESKDDGADINLRFEIGEDMAVKGVEARDKIDAIRDALPADIERVMVFKWAAGDIPMITFRISAERDLSAAYDMLTRNLKRRIERLPGVSRVELYGVEKKEIRIELIADRVAAHGVDLRQLAQTLQKANFALTAGEVVEAGRRYYVKPEGRFERTEDVEALVIGDNGLRLRDIADIRYAQPVQTYERHLDGKYAVGLDVFKETGANLVAVAERVHEEVDEVKQLPEMAGIRMILFQDSGADVKRSLRELMNAGLIGAGLSVLVLFLFLRDVRMTLIVTLAVPLSLVMTLAVMYFGGYSINILTLMGLLLSVGMLVDNSVVVTESIFKEAADHPGHPRDATLTGVGRVGLAVLLGTLTTSIVFLPNIFGKQNEITMYLSHVAVTICISLAASLLVAITLIPQLTSRVLASVPRPGPLMVGLSRRYERLLHWTLRNRGLTALFILGVLGSVAVPIAAVKTEMFSDSSTERLFLEYNLNNTYPLDKMRESVEVIEAHLNARKDEYEIESVYSYFDIGRALTLVYLRKEEQGRAKTHEEIKEAIRKGLPKIAIGEPTFETNRGGRGDKLSVQVWGESSDRLRVIAADVVPVLKRVPGLTDVRLDAAAGSWEVRVRVDRDRARLYGLSSQEVAEIVAGAMRGSPLKPFRGPNGEVEMRLEFRKADRTDLDKLLSLPLLTPSGDRIALSAVASLSIGDVPGNIRRENRRTALKILFDTSEGVTAEDAKKEIRAVLDQMRFPPGYGWAFGRVFDHEEEQMQTMVINMLLALACIYLVMAALFESVLAPSAIITGILFSFIGVYWFFFLTATVFSFMAMIGMLVLMGVVVNNGIVLIDHVHQLREEGLTREHALVQGSRDRLRPILMTALTTTLGMVPLAVGDTTIGGDGPPYYPMARAVIGGLLFATGVSLIVLPTIYLMLDDLAHWGRRVLARARGTPVPVPSAAEAMSK